MTAAEDVSVDISPIAPMLFVDGGRIFQADTCEPLKRAIEDNAVAFSGWARGNYPGVPIRDGLLAGVRSLGVWDADRAQSWGLGEHCNEGLEITYLSRGSLVFAAQGAPTRLSSQHVTVTRPWQSHEVGDPTVDASRLAWVIIDVGVRRPNQDWTWPDWVLLSAAERHRFARIIHNTDKTVWAARALEEPFEQLVRVLASAGPADAETEMKIVLNLILTRLLRLLDEGDEQEVPTRNRGRHTVEIFLERLQDHLGYEWTVADMASQCGLSKSAFVEHCRAILNVSPSAYLQRLRIERAKELLATEADKSLTDVAMECGFGSSSYFSTIFKQKTGLSPSEYRRDVSEAA